MPRDTNGNTQPLPGTIVSTGDTILPSQHNPAMVDLYAMMAQSLSRDGQGGMRSILDMSGFAVRNVGTATLDSDAVSLGQSRSNGVPVGTVVDFAGPVAPPGWMLCYGQVVSRATYANLYAALGGSSSVWGQGDGSTTFNIPDLRGRITAGKDNMGGTSANRMVTQIPGGTLGAAGGLETHTLTQQEIPAHQHSGSTSSDGLHSHTIPAVASSSSGGGFGSGSNATQNIGTSSNGLHAHSFVTNATGGGFAHNNLPPVVIYNKIIKVSS